MNLQQLKSYKPQIQVLAHKYHIDEIRVIGSVARGDEDEDGDIDFLIRPLPEADLLDLSGLNGELRDLLGRKVDFITENGANKMKFMKNVIFAEATPL